MRVSSVEQNTERQLADTGIQFDRVFEDKCSGVTKSRPELEELKRYAREHDTIHVHSIDRLARNLQDLRDLVKGWTKQGITVRFHKEKLEFAGGREDSIADMMLNILGAVAEFERSMIKQRQLEGIAKAKAKGVYKGRKKTVDEAAIIEELNTGTSMRKTAEKLGVSLSTVQRTKKKAGVQ
ncbi:recombinase family protein [Vibrio sp. SCSIO 43137]|nr:recombinase family protein [Vibrio sp. SCSIO 43137]WCE31266.1 recombinase family protein [Vibrio sp. SCSIO 43137]